MNDHRLTTLHLLNIVDAVCTLAALSQGVEELNPVMRLVLSHMGVMSFVLVKVFTVSAALTVLGHMLKPDQRWTLTGLCGVMGAVTCWHVYWLTVIA